MKPRFCHDFAQHLPAIIEKRFHVWRWGGWRDRLGGGLACENYTNWGTLLLVALRGPSPCLHGHDISPCQCQGACSNQSNQSRKFGPRGNSGKRKYTRAKRALIELGRVKHVGGKGTMHSPVAGAGGLPGAAPAAQVKASITMVMATMPAIST